MTDQDPMLEPFEALIGTWATVLRWVGRAPVPIPTFGHGPMMEMTSEPTAGVAMRGREEDGKLIAGGERAHSEA
jgi:acyl-CoA reductase-like NAD-dependent aldehyde dehydrogenase